MSVAGKGYARAIAHLRAQGAPAVASAIERYVTELRREAAVARLRIRDLETELALQDGAPAVTDWSEDQRRFAVAFSHGDRG